MSADLNNPFPGMNPWLESHWNSAHPSFIIYVRDQLVTQLPPGLAALTEERVAIENLRDDFKTIVVPDIAIEESWDGGASPLAAGSGLALAEPKVVMLEDPVDRSIHIVDSSGALITAVEVLSWTNKEDPRGRPAYLSKQRTYQEGGVNLVEIDLLRSGARVFRPPSAHFGDPAYYPYGASVWRARMPNRAFAYPMALQNRLPVIPIPLREQDADAVLDLQAVLNQTFRQGCYAYLIRYSSPPTPAFSSRDQAWAEKVLKEKGFTIDDDAA